MKIFLAIILLLSSVHTYAQQWLSKKYTYDSTLNVTYGTGINFNGGIDTLKMDIYTPLCDDNSHESKRPLLMWIHGGAFISGSKEDASITDLCKQFAKRGYVTASIGYRLGFISDDVVHTCNYPDYSCVFATDSAEWYRAYYRGIQDAKGALRYLINRYSQFRIDTGNVFVAGESAGALTALGIALMDTSVERLPQTYAMADAPVPGNYASGCSYNAGKTFSATVSRPDLGDIDGSIEPTTINFTIKGVGNMYGGMLSDLFRYHKSGKPRPSIYSYHQPCDLVVPIDSGAVMNGVSWCMTNGYGCYGISNTAKVYGSRAMSNWNTANSYGYTIQNDFTTTTFPYSFLIGTASCADQVNHPCHGYDDKTLRENNLALFFSTLITTSPICDTTSSLSVEHITDNTFTIYPNPVEKILTLKAAVRTLLTAELYDTFGRLLKKEELKDNQLDLSDITSGLYFLIIMDREGDTRSLRIIKE